MFDIKTLKATGVYTILGFIPLISSFILLPIYTRFLSPADYGIVSLATMVESFLYIFILFGLNHSFMIYYYDYIKVDGGANKLLSVTLSSIVLVSLICFIFLFFAAEPIFGWLFNNRLHFNQYGWYIFSNVIFLSLNQVLFQYYRIRGELKNVMFIVLVPFIFNIIGGLVGIVYLELGALGSVAGKALGTIIGSLAIQMVIFWKVGFSFDKTIIKQIFSYGFPFFLVLLITQLSDSVDKIILNQLFDLKTLGIYTFASVVISPIGILLQSYWNSVTPVMYESLSKGESKDALKPYFKMLIVINILALWGLIMVIEPTIKFVTKGDFSLAAYYVPGLCIGTLGRAYYNIYTFSISFEKKTKFLPIANIAALAASICFSYILVPYFNIWGIIIAFVLSKLIQNSIVFIIDKKLKYNSFPIFSGSWMIIISIGLIILNYVFLYKIIHPSERFILNFLEAILIFSLVIYINRKSLKLVRN
ncbi:lipopolysaccharide biosynthesis protein [Adhaeribacter aquaticus]|uniref:lipopolysaccharide biosynthesis protein n=1 Tax=Adhaeribacter aquaticus TaxID=299567 RepID=UPI0003FFA23E|nr:oligosaccharide flippase family protein [Adhaeribacter aquaticus]